MCKLWFNPNQRNIHTKFLRYYCLKLKPVNLSIKIDKFIDPFLRCEPYIVSFTSISLSKLLINIFLIYQFFGNNRIRQLFLTLMICLSVFGNVKNCMNWSGNFISLWTGPNKCRHICPSRTNDAFRIVTFRVVSFKQKM